MATTTSLNPGRPAPTGSGRPWDGSPRGGRAPVRGRSPPGRTGRRARRRGPVPSPPRRGSATVRRLDRVPAGRPRARRAAPRRDRGGGTPRRRPAHRRRPRRRGAPSPRPARPRPPTPARWRPARAPRPRTGSRRTPPPPGACAVAPHASRRHSSARIRRISMQRGYPAREAGGSWHSPVRPSQQPTLKRQRGHWNVPCRHSIAAPQRRHGSVTCCAAVEGVVRHPRRDGTPAAGWASHHVASVPPPGTPATSPAAPHSGATRLWSCLDYRRRSTGNETSLRVEMPPQQVAARLARADEHHEQLLLLRRGIAAQAVHPQLGPPVATRRGLGRHGELVVRHRRDVHERSLDRAAVAGGHAEARHDLVGGAADDRGLDGLAIDRADWSHRALRPGSSRCRAGHNRSCSAVPAPRGSPRSARTWPSCGRRRSAPSRSREWCSP